MARRIPLAVAALLAAALGASACGPATPEFSGPGSSHSGHAPHLATYVVTTEQVGGRGTILADGKGYTLYLFLPDHDSQSDCYSACMYQWPPLLLPKGVKRPVARGEAVAALLGTTRRRNGSLQVTYKGWPLYTFIYDSSPGEAHGIGIDNLGGLWYALAPDGSEVR